ncbi:hypothetical protein HMPREF1248_0332 [Coriobacteriaceae bacterium BV3Ac1]|nr:hypothetical protein HMPREF1248_0332 [Coriobacteriaceae bacterium BV3Ac1]
MQRYFDWLINIGLMKTNKVIVLVQRYFDWLINLQDDSAYSSTFWCSVILTG